MDMDTVSPQRRSEIMRRIRGKDTAPELAVRRFLHGEGLRFRLHRAGLPGTPDLVFPARRTCVFVHGCFWHGCQRCKAGRRRVKSNAAYWAAKLAANRARDRRAAAALRAAGWRVLAVWECEVRDARALARLAAAVKKQTCGSKKADTRQNRACAGPTRAPIVVQSRVHAA
jgi:DNA mismatch endonuclease (patch repair protein)